MVLALEPLLDPEICGEIASVEFANELQSDSEGTSTVGLEEVETLAQTAIGEVVPTEAGPPQYRLSGFMSLPAELQDTPLGDSFTVTCPSATGFASLR